MIVKDEAPVIARCLSSVKHLIDYWVIVDTGSTDGTQDIIRDCLKNIPGELHERPWVDFAHNRNQALELAKNKGDYLFFIDADEELAISNAFSMPTLSKDFYLTTVEIEGACFQRKSLVNNRLTDWHWTGIVHEAIDSAKAKTFERLVGISTLAVTKDGHRTQDPEKYSKDAATLEKALEADPTNSRYVFVLAQSYACCGQYTLALNHYQKRVNIGGWDEEIFWSLFMIGELKALLGEPDPEVINAYHAAYQYRPTRAEPLFRIADIFYQYGAYDLAQSLLDPALALQPPNDLLTLYPWVYNYGLLCLRSRCAHKKGNYEEERLFLELLLQKEHLPRSIREQAEMNIHSIQ